jgi:hypothetical protein
MFAKRKFQNFVATYGDQSISGKKTFTENLLVTGECTLPDSINITLGPSTIPQSSIISTSGWLYDILTQLIGSVTDLVSDLTNNTFGYVKTTDLIPQSHVDETDSYGWITGIYKGLDALKAPKESPTFTGTVTFPDNSTITDYLKSSSASSTYAIKNNAVFSGDYLLFPDASNYADYLLIDDASNTYLTKSSASSTYAPKASPTFTGTVIFPDTSTITDYLKSSTAASTYLTTSSASSTYAPKASPTFTGTISLNGDVTLASAYTNTLTLNDHLVLCTGSNFTTPVSGQQGYIITGTSATNQTSITTQATTTYSTITLSYGVWMVIGQIGFQNITGGTTATLTIRNFCINDSVAIAANYAIRYNHSIALAATSYSSEMCTRIVTVTNASTLWYLVGALTYTNGPLYTASTDTNLYAVRIA